MVEQAQDDNERDDQPMKRIGSEIGIPGTRARLTCKSEIQNRDVQGNAGEEIDCNMKGNASLRKELSAYDIEKVGLTITL